jgi:hypothetical protein
MFDSGTKVKVLASTRRKKAGPRRGSVGYVGDFEMCLVIPELDVRASLFQVYFHQFGLEKNASRMEKREVIVLSPTMPMPAKEAKEVIGKLSRKLTTGEDKVWSPVRASFGRKQMTPVVLMAPVYGDLMRAKANELYCWISSLVTSSDFHQYTGKAHSQGHTWSHFMGRKDYGPLSRRTMQNLNDMSGNTQSRKNWASSLADCSKDLKAVAIRDIHIYRSEVIRFAINNSFKNSFDMIEMGMFSNSHNWHPLKAKDNPNGLDRSKAWEALSAVLFREVYGPLLKALRKKHPADEELYDSIEAVRSGVLEFSGTVG